jgi:hypothetical protein
MKSMKIDASAKLKLSFDLSRGERMRLKSPRMAREPVSRETDERSESRKAGLSPCMQGP